MKLDPACTDYCRTIVRIREMIAWIEAAKDEPIAIEELEVEF